MDFLDSEVLKILDASLDHEPEGGSPARAASVDDLPRSERQAIFRGFKGRNVGILMPVVACVLVAAPVFAEELPVRMLVPGFTVTEVPVSLSNQNNLRFAPDGSLTSLGYDGRVWTLRDTDGDGVEDQATIFWDRPTLSVPLGMAWTTEGLLVSSKGKISLLRDGDGDGRADTEEVLASGWAPTDVGSGGVDATAVTLDESGNVYFGLLVADYSNAYRLRRRKDLTPDEVDWLKRERRWTEPNGPGGENDEFSLYDLKSVRGTVQRWDSVQKKQTTVATGIRVPVALAINRRGDLFNTDQEGETWMPNGNPRDELNWIRPGRNYGFPPAHERWLPGLVSEAPVVEFGPQHQSACGLVFNEPKRATPSSAGLGTRKRGGLRPAGPAQARFGPAAWAGDAFVAGESRGKIWRVTLRKGGDGYRGSVQTVARLDMLVTDLAISPSGALYVSCHSGPPDWGTGPLGHGRIFRIAHTSPATPVPLAAWPVSPTELAVRFSGKVEVDRDAAGGQIEFGEYVSSADRYEVLKPPYEVVRQQAAAPRGRLKIRSVSTLGSGRELRLTTDMHTFDTRYALTLEGVRPSGGGGAMTVDLEYDLTMASQPAGRSGERGEPTTRVAWAPDRRVTSGTASRPGERPDGDVARGRELFFGETLKCSRCHRVRGEGGVAGPDLSQLIHRDRGSVVRDIREPNSTLHPDYVSYRAETRSGEIYDGFLRSDGGNPIRLFDVDGREVVLAREDVVNLQPTGMSLMPAGLLDALSERDVEDLLTFLMR